MNEKIKNALASVKGYTTRKDEQLPTFRSEEELKRQKRIKLFTYIGIFFVFQIIVMTVFGLTNMKVKTPKVRLGTTSVQNLNFVPTTPSFDTTFDTTFATQIRVKNTNWGPYKFDAGIATFIHQGVAVGQVPIPKSKAGMRSTKKINVEVSLNSNGLPSTSNLGSELSSGVLTLTSEAKLTGKAELMSIMKKKKSTTMNCAMKLDLSTKTIQALECK